MDSAGEDRLFRMLSASGTSALDNFYTGTLPNGRQVLLGWNYEGLVVLTFDIDGNFLTGREVTTGKNKGNHALLLGWQKRSGFVHGPIAVKHFYITEPVLAGIRMMPDFMLELLCDPYSERPRTSQEMKDQSVADWKATDSFVLHWEGEKHFLGNNTTL